MPQINLTKGFIAVIDPEDEQLVRQYKWQACKTKHACYAVHSYWDGSYHKLPMHHLILPPGAGEFIDHRDGDGLNNTRSNLRRATRSQNNQNRHPNIAECAGIKSKSDFRPGYRLNVSGFNSAASQLS